MRFVIIKAACIAAILSSPWTASSQHYYVVFGAFAAEGNASELNDYFPAHILDTSFTKAEKENLLHFYVLRTSDKQSAISKTLQLKKDIESLQISGSEPDGLRPEQPLSGKESLISSPGSERAETSAEAPAKIHEITEGASASGAISTASASAGKTPPAPLGKYFKFKIESPKGTPIAARVHHVDFDRGLELAAYKTNTFVDLLRPGQSHKPMAVVCALFGYKEIHKYIDYRNPSATDGQAYVDPQGAWVIPYNLERVTQGDVSVMYNVSFYKDAVVMRSDSRKDLDELVKMMHSNPYYEITIHAYCNGKKKREIIALGPNKNYFDVSGSVRMIRSAKDLTELRAEAVQSYLVDHGIDESRIKTFAWGGNDMLVDADGPHANVNDRIEIEFTRD